MAYHLDVNDNDLSLEASAPGDSPPAVHLIEDSTMSHFTCKRTPLTLALMLAFGAPLAVHAQTTTGRMAADPDSVPTVVVSASALGVVHDDMITPVTSLGGAELVRARESTLGETLAHQPGITSSHFGWMARA